MRSIDMHFMGPCRVHICGDYLPEWVIGVAYHPFVFSPDRHTDANIAPVLEWACRKFTDFVWMADDMYFLKDTFVSDLLPHPHIGNLSQVVVRGKRPWQKRLWATVDMLESEGISPVYNHVTHTPSLYNSANMLACADQFPVFTGEALHEVVYYNIFKHGVPPELKEKAGFYGDNDKINIYGQQIRYLNHDDNGLSEKMKQEIKNRFDTKSQYER